MINNFDINYAPQGLAVLRGGKPAVVTMAMSLTEMDIHTAEDYYNGYIEAAGGDIEVTAYSASGPNEKYTG
jgi:hypothetical protein